LTTVTAHVIIYEAFIESELVVPKHLSRLGHGDYFRNLKNSSLGRFGAFQMLSGLRSRSLSQFLSSGRL
jgi:hypothetical protein